MKRTQLKRSSPLRRAKAPQGRREARALREGPLDPFAWRMAVWVACEGRCVMTGAAVPRDADLWVWQAHHPVPKFRLPPELRYDPRNGVVLTKRAHEQHTLAFRRVPLGCLPSACHEFAAQVGPWAVAALEREHPSA